jgi:deazaflavin-dependent oxidoreductase (nitroreductase family)
MAKRYVVNMKVRLVNKLVTFLVNRGKTDSWILATTGRVSGNRHEVPVTPVEVDGVKYLCAPYGRVGWVRNIEAQPQATMKHGGASIRFTAEPVEGEEAGRAFAKYYADNKKYIDPYVAIAGDKTITDFTAATRRYPVFKVAT